MALSRKLDGPEHTDTLDVMTELAIAYGEADRLEDAIKLQEEVLTVNRNINGTDHPDTLGAMTNLAIFYDYAGRLEEATTLQAEALALKRDLLPAAHPSFAIALGHMAGLYQRTGQVDEALVLNEELFQLSPDDPDAINTIAWQIASSPDLDGKFPCAKQAIQWAHRANELRPEDGSLLNTLGVSLFRAEQWQESSEALQKSIELGEDGPYNWLFVAMANWQLEQKDKAKEWYDKSLAWKAGHAVDLQEDTELQGFFGEAAALIHAMDNRASVSDTGPKSNSEAPAEKTAGKDGPDE